MTPKRDDRDAGLGLIELIVAIVVSGIVLAGIAAVFVRSWQTQEEVLSVSEATNRGQTVGAAIERAVRNAVFIQVLDTGNTLRVATTLTGSLKCQGFRLSSVDGGAARFSASSGALGDESTWAVWQSGIMEQSPAPYFDASTPGIVKYRFQIQTDSAPVRFAGEVSPRSVQRGDSDSCWP